MNDWLTEYCTVCGACNHIYLPPDQHIQAWECWCCFNIWWIDDLEKIYFMNEQGIIDSDEADDMLIKCNELIHIGHGHSEKVRYEL